MKKLFFVCDEIEKDFVTHKINLLNRDYSVKKVKDYFMVTCNDLTNNQYLQIRYSMLKYKDLKETFFNIFDVPFESFSSNLVKGGPK